MTGGSKPMPEPDLIAFGVRLQELREAVGLSRRELADRADISPSFLRVLESATNPKTNKPSKPSSQHVERLAQGLDADVGELLALAGQEPAGENGSDDGPVAEPRRPRPASNVDALLKDLRAATRDLIKRSPFMYQRAVDRLAEFDVEFRHLCSGTLKCAPEDEPYVTQLAVQQCRSHLRAVSFEDLSWFKSDQGDVYREVHEKLRRDEVEITRIFLARPEERSMLRPTVEWHLELGIQTYVLDMARVPERRREDFILCDESLLRTAVAVSEDLKRAEFTDEGNRIREKRVDFDVLRELAVASGALLRSIDDLDRSGAA